MLYLDLLLLCFHQHLDLFFEIVIVLFSIYLLPVATTATFVTLPPVAVTTNDAPDPVVAEPVIAAVIPANVAVVAEKFHC